MTSVDEGRNGSSPFLPPSTTELEKNDARSQHILECRKHIKVWQDKLKVLLVEQQRYRELTRLRLDASTTWATLKADSRLDKRYILAALESKKLPKSLKSFGEDVFPLDIRTDRDIFLARLRHPDFETTFHQNANLIVPPILRDDKDIMMKLAQRQPLAVRTMPDRWRDDKDILRCALKNQNIPSDTLQYFSKEVRSDPELMFEVFQHPKSEFSWIEHCSASLRDNKRFLTSVVEEFHLAREDDGDALLHNIKARNHILQYASQSLQSDFEFVMTCVCQSGMNLGYAAEDLRRNEAIVIAACLQEGKLIESCTAVAVENDLLDDKKFAEEILGSASPEILQLCLEKHGHEQEFCQLSLLNKNLKWSMIPEPWRSNVDFVALALERIRYGEFWWEIPLEMKRNFKVASAVSKCPHVSSKIVVDAFELCPEILSDRQVLKDLLSNVRYYVDSHDDWMPRVIEISDIDIQNDKEIMLGAIKNRYRFREHCSEQLQADDDILLAAADDSYYTALSILDGIYQLDHPNFVARVIQKYPKERDSIYDHVRPDLWQNRDVAMAWLSSGGDWLDWEFPPQFIEDKEMILTAIKHHWVNFRKASDTLKKDTSFVLKALEIDAQIIQEADDSIFFDDDIVLEAFTRNIRTIQFYVEGDEDCFAFLVPFARKVRKRLREYWAFRDEFIASITMKSPNGTNPEGCLLPMLNQGPVMLTTYENKIASYAGILHEEDELARYESVSTNLAQWGI